jgi:hypothetical protein
VDRAADAEDNKDSALVPERASGNSRSRPITIQVWTNSPFME